MVTVFINGPATSGKDTFMKMCKKACKGKAKTISLADKPKAALSILGWNGEKTEEFRKLLSDLKILADEKFNMSNQYIQETMKVIEKRKNKPLILFVCAREIEDIKNCTTFLDGMGKKNVTLLIEREGVDPILSNVADAQVRDYSYEFVIRNDGSLEELQEKASNFVKEIL